METAIYFIKLNKFHSKAKDKDYYTIEYIQAENKKYYMEFITPELYDNIADKDLDFLELYQAKFGIGNGRNLVINDIIG